MASYENASTIAALKEQVRNYQEFSVKKSDTAPADAFTSAVFSKDVLQKLLDTAPDTHGVRIYLAKSSTDDTPEDISYLVVPVKKEDDGSFTDQIDDDSDHIKFGLLAMADCIWPFCKGGSLVEDGSSEA